MTEPLRLNIDASSLPAFDCFRKFYNRHVLFKSPEGNTANDTEYGSGFHVFVETLAKTQNEMLACSGGLNYFAKRRAQGMVIKEKKQYLDESHLGGLMLRYVNEFDKQKSWGKYEYLRFHDGSPLVEQTFDIPFYKSEFVDIHLQGTIDEIVLHPAGYAVIQDFKTTSQWDIRGHLNSFEMKPQLLFYRLALTLLAEQPNGEWFQELLTRRIGARINGVFLKPDVAACIFEQSQVFEFVDRDIEFMRQWLFTKCKDISDFVETGATPPPDGRMTEICSGKYGQPCVYINACRAPRDEMYASIINNMPTKKYEPLMFRKIEECKQES